MIKSFTWILGIVLLVVGLIGFVSAPVLGLFDVDTVHNLIHVISGIIAIAAVSSGESYARLYLIIFGIVYGAVAVVGFANNGDVFSIIHTNNADNYLHTVIALACLGVGFGGKK